MVVAYSPQIAIQYGSAYRPQIAIQYGRAYRPQIAILITASVFQSGQVGTTGDVREQRSLRHHVHSVRVGRLPTDLHHSRAVCFVEDEPVGTACLLSAVQSQ